MVVWLRVFLIYRKVSGRIHTSAALLPKKQRTVTTADLNAPPPSKYITPTGVRTRIPLSSNPCPSHYTDYMAHIHSYLQQHVISHYQCWIHTTDDTFSSQLRATAVVLGSTSPHPLHEICKCDVTNFSRILFFLLIFV